MLSKSPSWYLQMTIAPLQPITSALVRERRQDVGEVREILAKAGGLSGLSNGEAAVLAELRAPELIAEVFATARAVKEAIYGSRLVFFAPLYISNFCGNDCSYCGFRAGNNSVTRRTLDSSEITAETLALLEQGHKRLLLVAGEAGSKSSFRHVLEAIEAIYATRWGDASIRRINVNVAPMSGAEFAQLREAGIGTYQLFQETYHRGTYAKVHRRGRKRDYDARLAGIDRAMEAGLDDVGIGVLFGLYDWREELLALLQHARGLEVRHGVGPHTISVPRLEPASGSRIAHRPPHPVSDEDFLKLVAILRLALPYTGIILSTRESREMRRACLALGVSQISAGSRTNPGGYGSRPEASEQFGLGDQRSLDEVVRDAAEMGHLPSFCTGCYRLGRTGADFMDLARPGEIKRHCEPNAFSSFMEYLLDHASPETRVAGERLIRNRLNALDSVQRKNCERLIGRVREGKRDIFV